jgi:tetratricopeptide (TPR) repeat protein
LDPTRELETPVKRCILPRTPQAVVGACRLSTALLSALSLWLAGCASTRPAATPPERGRSTETRVTLPRTVVTPERVTSIPELYASAAEHARRSEYRLAAAEFDRVVALDPSGELADDALFEAAAAYDQSARFDDAVARYEQLVRRFPESSLSMTALVRATRLVVHLERWERAGELAQRVLSASGERGPFELVVAYGASALARLAIDDEQGAAMFIEKGRAVVDAHQLDAAGSLDRDLAALYFALGELRRRRADRIVFKPMPADFADALERRCQLLLDAQSAYSDAMRARDAHWSMMAGYRVGELYHRLHIDLMQVTPPASADTQAKRDLFEGAMRLRYSILLTKALGMIEHTIRMIERVGERSSWSARLTQARSEITAAIAAEEAAIDRLPYSRATLQAGLADLTQRAEQKARSDAKASGGSPKTPTKSR